MDPLNRVREQLICAVCMETYRDPKMLPCLHSFCSICLQSFIQSFVSRQSASRRGEDQVVDAEGNGKSTWFECPTCRERVTVGDLPRGIHSLPSNFWIVSMVEAVNQEESSRLIQNGDGFCNLCPDDDRDAATSLCNDCHLLLCPIHLAAHSKSRESRHHSISSLPSPLNPQPNADASAQEDASSSNQQRAPSPLSQRHASSSASPEGSPSPFRNANLEDASSKNAAAIAGGKNFVSNPPSASSSHLSASSSAVQSPISTRPSHSLSSSASAAIGVSSPIASSSASPAPSSLRTPGHTHIYRCTSHPEEVLKIFCDSCQVPICRDCALVEHRDHAYSFVEKSSEMHRKRLGSALRVTETQIEGVQKLEGRINELWNLVRVNSNDMLLSIRELFSDIKSSLDRREQELLVQVETSRQERLMFLHQHKEHLESSRELLQNAYNSSSEIHDQAGDIELLMLHSTLISRLALLTTKIDVKSLETDFSRLLLPGSPIGRLIFSPDSSHTKNAINTLGKLTVSPDSIIAAPPEGKKRISSPINRLYDRLTAPVLRIGSNDPDALEAVAFDPPPPFLEPWGVVVSNNEEVVVVDASRALVHIESPPAISISRSVALPSDKYDPIPIGVIFDTFGNIVITDQANNMVKVLLADGGCKGLGIEGSEPCQFRRPCGLALEARSEQDGGTWIWVVDQGNQRVQAFTQPLWTHRQSFTQFSEPCAIAVDHKSKRIIVTDTGARLHILQRGNHDVKVTLTIKNYPNYDEDMPAATGIVIDENGNAIIADTFQNKLFVVRLTDGQIIAQIGNGTFKSPRGLFISPSGRLFVTDHHRIQAF